MENAGIRILVVDDEPGLCAGLQEGLRREGYTVDAANDAAAALKLVGVNLYNLVISDVKMPGASGMDLLAQIRERHRDTLFILMTAFSTVENAVTAMRLELTTICPSPSTLSACACWCKKPSNTRPWWWKTTSCDPACKNAPRPPRSLARARACALCRA